MTQTGLITTRIRDTRIASLPLFLLLAVSAPRFPIEDYLEWVGYFLLIACVLGRSLCAVHIGGRKKHELVVSGPYSVVRNPLYLFSFFGVAGIGAVSGMVSITLLLMLAFAGYYSVVVRREEAYLLARHGQDYARYGARTARWLPRFEQWSEPSEILLRPRHLATTMRDSAWFLVAFPAIELLEYFQEQDLLPVLIYLP